MAIVQFVPLENFLNIRRSNIDVQLFLSHSRRSVILCSYTKDV